MSVHREAGLVASVSDDRSVRLWRLRTDSGATKEGGVVSRSSSFVRSIVGLAEGSDCDSTDRLGFHQEWAAWGHQARIWDVEFVRGRPSGGGGAEGQAPQGGSPLEAAVRNDQVARWRGPLAKEQDWWMVQ